jgi:hypothetical protein
MSQRQQQQQSTEDVAKAASGSLLSWWTFGACVLLATIIILLFTVPSLRFPAPTDDDDTGGGSGGGGSGGDGGGNGTDRFADPRLEILFIKITPLCTAQGIGCIFNIYNNITTSPGNSNAVISYYINGASTPSGSVTLDYGQGINITAPANSALRYAYSGVSSSQYLQCNAAPCTTYQPPPPACVYDQCGRCNGDNSTCPWTNPNTPYAINTTLEQHVTCAVMQSSQVDDVAPADLPTDCASGDTIVYLQADATYIAGLSSANVSLACVAGQKAVQDKIASRWRYRDLFLKYTDGVGQIYVRQYYQHMCLKTLMQCLTTNGSTAAIGVQGVMNITSPYITQPAYGNGGYALQYIAPCAFGVSMDNTGGTLSTYYGVSKLGFMLRSIQTVWTTDATTSSSSSGSASADDLLLVVQTCVTRPNGNDTFLRHVSTSGEFDGIVGAQLASSAQPTCDQSSPMWPGYCCQFWAVTTTNGRDQDCFVGSIESDFSVVVSGSAVNRTFAGTVNVDACKPRAATTMILPGPAQSGYNVSVSLYQDEALQVPSASFLDGDRIYAKVKLVGASAQMCDYMQLNIREAQLCAPINPNVPMPLGCADPNADAYTILNITAGQDYWGGAYWRTAVSPIYEGGGTQPCRYEGVLSWLAHFINRFSGQTGMRLELKYDVSYYVAAQSDQQQQQQQQQVISMSESDAFSTNFFAPQRLGSMLLSPRALFLSRPIPEHAAATSSSSSSLSSSLLLARNRRLSPYQRMLVGGADRRYSHVAILAPADRGASSTLQHFGDATSCAVSGSSVDSADASAFCQQRQLSITVRCASGQAYDRRMGTCMSVPLVWLMDDWFDWFCYALGVLIFWLVVIALCCSCCVAPPAGAVAAKATRLNARRDEEAVVQVINNITIALPHLWAAAGAESGAALPSRAAASSPSPAPVILSSKLRGAPFVHSKRL